MKMRLQYLLLVIIGVGLGVLACQPKNDPGPSPSSFIVIAKIVPGVADLKPNHLVNNISLTWEKVEAQVGDSITYLVIYKDTLAKNLTDTTFTISNVGDNVVVQGQVVAKSNRGVFQSASFNLTVGVAPRLRLKSVLTESYQLRFFHLVQYSYDSQNRLVSFIASDGKQCCYQDHPAQRTVLSYNAVGQLIRVEGLPNDDNTGHSENYVHTYTYNANGALSMIRDCTTTYQRLPRRLTNEHHFNYNSSVLPAGEIGYAESNSSTGPPIFAYTYQNDDLVNVQSRFSSGPVRYSATYSYDSNPNPYYGLLFYDQYSSIAVSFSRHNQTGPGDWNTYDANGLVDYSQKTGPRAIITYDANGLMVKRVGYGSSDWKETFEYESY